ncbi:hypothetical protein BU23DRAFT_648882 [Bimuria novae-zelandiae CBS 107.79]|uniref:Uncharacterized protein n=1 Tax=Bimuria novae-zelandiae CBS 107.79 TaxID=1447943 RepID=A0A6A5V0X5_9PLEO|nr:hypothetical protein BU23DRAFT_648882 [Bimuria novae-zelandiae CBS 107.79]
MAPNSDRSKGQPTRSVHSDDNLIIAPTPKLKEFDVKMSIEELRKAVTDLAHKKSGAYHQLGKQLELDEVGTSNRPEANEPEPTASQIYTIELAVEDAVEKIVLDKLNGQAKFKNELDNEVHPVFGKKQWLDLSEEEFSIITPVLRLASMFLSTPPCWEFYEHVATGLFKTNYS